MTDGMISLVRHFGILYYRDQTRANTHNSHRPSGLQHANRSMVAHFAAFAEMDQTFSLSTCSKSYGQSQRKHPTLSICPDGTEGTGVTNVQLPKWSASLAETRPQPHPDSCFPVKSLEQQAGHRIGQDGLQHNFASTRSEVHLASPGPLAEESYGSLCDRPNPAFTTPTPANQRRDKAVQPSSGTRYQA